MPASSGWPYHLARAPAYDMDAVKQAYGGDAIKLAEFSRDNLIPTPFDPRLLVYIAPAVVRAAEVRRCRLTL
jgi:malic enzyme